MKITNLSLMDAIKFAEELSCGIRDYITNRTISAVEIYNAKFCYSEMISKNWQLSEIKTVNFIKMVTSLLTSDTPLYACGFDNKFDFGEYLITVSDDGNNEIMWRNQLFPITADTINAIYVIGAREK
jgi:hypothetical protein